MKPGRLSMKRPEKIIWAICDLLPASWPMDTRMFVTGMVLGSVVSIPVVFVLVLVGLS